MIENKRNGRYRPLELTTIGINILPLLRLVRKLAMIAKKKVNAFIQTIMETKVFKNLKECVYITISQRLNKPH